MICWQFWDPIFFRIFFCFLNFFSFIFSKQKKKFKPDVFAPKFDFSFEFLQFFCPIRLLFPLIEVLGFPFFQVCHVRVFRWLKKPKPFKKLIDKMFSKHFNKAFQEKRSFFDGGQNRSQPIKPNKIISKSRPTRILIYFNILSITKQKNKRKKIKSSKAIDVQGKVGSKKRTKSVAFLCDVFL